MSRMKGNYGLTEVGFPEIITPDEADAIGREWVGPNARVVGNGLGVESADGLRLYRFATAKGYSDGVPIANYEWRSDPDQRWVGNAHVTVGDSLTINQM